MASSRTTPCPNDPCSYCNIPHPICQHVPDVMKFSQDPQSNVTIRKLERGEITVGKDTFRSNVIIDSDRVITTWPFKDIASATYADIQPHLSGDTEVVLLGTGWSSLAPPRELVYAIARKGIGFESMDTPAACRTFNILLGEMRNVTAFLQIRD